MSPLANRCAYCGHWCRGPVCRFHRDLPNVDPHYNRAVVALVQRSFWFLRRRRGW